MTMAAHSALDGDLFQHSRDAFEGLVGWLGSRDVPLDHAELEEGLDRYILSILRFDEADHPIDLSTWERLVVQGREA